MNIFYLDHDPSIAARMHNDKHVVKMQLESAQLLSNAIWLTSQWEGPYKLTHVHHPCTLWVCESYFHWKWLYNLMIFLQDEWRYRFDHPESKEHASVKAIQDWLKIGVSTVSEGVIEFRDTANWVHSEFNDPPKCTGPYIRGNTIQCYRNYYKHEKADISTFTKRTNWLEII